MTYKYDEKTSKATERAYRAPQIQRQRRATLARVAAQSGERALDIGSGPGMLLRDLAKAVGEAGLAVGVDSSSAMLELAAARCHNLPQVELKKGSATELPLDNEAFDFATCVQVLLYVDEVDRALREFLRVLRPGGRLFIMETDWRSAVLNSGDGALTEKVIGSWDAMVPSPNLPASLAPMLRQAGFKDIEVQAVSLLSTSQDEYASIMLKQTAKSAQKTGVLDESSSRSWLEDLRQREQNGSFFFCVNRFLFSAVR